MFLRTLNLSLGLILWHKAQGEALCPWPCAYISSKYKTQHNKGEKEEEGQELKTCVP